jgi:hypothetical protein
MAAKAASSSASTQYYTQKEHRRPGQSRQKTEGGVTISFSRTATAPISNQMIKHYLVLANLSGRNLTRGNRTHSQLKGAFWNESYSSTNGTGHIPFHSVLLYMVKRILCLNLSSQLMKLYYCRTIGIKHFALIHYGKEKKNTKSN